MAEQGFEPGPSRFYTTSTPNSQTATASWVSLLCPAFHGSSCGKETILVAVCSHALLDFRAWAAGNKTCGHGSCVAYQHFARNPGSLTRATRNKALLSIFNSIPERRLSPQNMVYIKQSQPPGRVSRWNPITAVTVTYADYIIHEVPS